MEDLRLCVKCNKEKCNAEFRSPKRGKICLECCQNRVREWQSSNRDKMNANQRRYLGLPVGADGEPIPRFPKPPDGFRRCSRCTEVKPLAEMTKQLVYCKACDADKSWEWRQRTSYKTPKGADWTSGSLRKSKFLGMPYGTACHRLRLSIMFSLIVRCGENICFRCGREIENAKELSVEHKREWLNESPELFWDLSNISFSHRLCNVNRRSQGRRNKVSVLS